MKITHKYRFKTVYNNSHNEYDLSRERALKLLKSGYWKPYCAKYSRSPYTFRIIYEKGKYICELTEVINS